MFKFLTLIFALSPIFSSASTNGGGVLRANPDSRDIVYFRAEGNGFTLFAYGKKVEAAWKVDQFKIDDSDLKRFPSLSDAIKNSKASGDWFLIKARSK